MTRRRGAAARGPRYGWLVAVATALLVALTGCAPAPDLAADRAAELQQAVLTVSQEAAAGRYDAAAAALEDVRTRLEAAADAGGVSTARYRTIDDALDRTAAELDAVLAAQAAEQAAAAQAAAEQAAAEQAAAEQAAAEQAAAEQAAADAAAAQKAAADKGRDGGPGGKGKGKDD